MNKPSILFKDNPLFGLDIGFNSLKVMQLSDAGQDLNIGGYGAIGFDESAFKNGSIDKPDIIAKAAFELFDKHIIGKIDTRRVALALPTARAYSRMLTLPVTLSASELAEAVHFEAEQYIPISVDDLYLDYVCQRINGDNCDILMVAVPKKIIDSYIQLVSLLGLELIEIETSLLSAIRLIAATDDAGGIPSMLIDFGSNSVDLSIYDQIPVITGTILGGGGDDFTKTIADKLKVSLSDAHTIKTKYGLSVSKRQAEIKSALDPLLTVVIKEIHRIMRYFEERNEHKAKIEQVITLGGGANMPGLAEYLTDNLHLAVRYCDPWQKLHFKHIEPPDKIERSRYLTAAGLCIIKPKDVWG